MLERDWGKPHTSNPSREAGMVAHFLFYDFQVKGNNHAKLGLQVPQLLSPLPFIGLASPEISESLPCPYPGQSPDCSRLHGNGCSKVNLFDLNILVTTNKSSKVRNISVFSLLIIGECFTQILQPWFSNSGVMSVTRAPSAEITIQ